MASSGLIHPNEISNGEKQLKIATVQANIAHKALKRGIPLIRNQTHNDKLMSLEQHLQSKSSKGIKSNCKRKSEEIQDVQSLNDIIPTTSGDESLEERIREKRRKRHDQVVFGMNQSLDLMSNQFRTEVEGVCTHFNTCLQQNDQVVDKVLSENSKDNEAILQSSYESLVSLWSSIESRYEEERKAIEEFEEQIMEIQDKHSKMISQALTKHTETLYTVAYLLPHDVDKVIEEEAMKINLTILNNKKCYIKLCRDLTTASYKKQTVSRHCWEDVVKQWRHLMCNRAEQKFKQYMDSEEIMNPFSIQQLRHNLITEQVSVRQQLESHLQQLSVLSPPQATKGKIYEWKENYLKILQHIEQMQSTFIMEWQQYQDEVCTHVEKKMEHVKDSLITEQILDSSDAYQFLSERFVPILESHQTQIREELRTLEYSQGASHLWDTYLLNLDETSRSHEHQLASLRNQHDTDNQTLEANLDYVLDRLRQASSQEELQDYLRQSLEMLDNIKSGYVTFYETMLNGAHNYPSLIQSELTNYDNELCKYFGVDRVPPKKKKKAKTPKTTPGGTRSESRGTKLSRSKLSVSRASSVGSMVSSSDRSPTSLSSVIDEVIATSSGTSFYVLSQGGLTQDTAGSGAVFLTQDEDIEGSVQTFATESLVIADAKYIEARKGFCSCFLNNLETWKNDKLREAESITLGKEEEFKTELELRLHLHEPRPSRIKQDIHDVRTAEILGHQERLAYHVKGISTSLKEEKTKVNKLWEILNNEIAHLSTSLSTVFTKLSNCSTTTRIKKVHTEAEDIFSKYSTKFTEVFNTHQSLTQDSLQELSRSNEEYLQSIKLFSEGGNYCPNEVDIFKTKLEKQVQRIERYQKQITEELKSLEQVGKERLSDTYSAEFAIKYDHHLMDLVFLENVNKILTNCQVQIKTEVAASNGQSLKLTDKIEALEEKLKKVDLTDKLSGDTLLSSLLPLFEALHQRVSYLYCQIEKLQGARVGKPNLHLIAPTPISAVDITRSIMNYTGGPNSSDKKGNGTKNTSERKGLTATTDQSKQGKVSVSKRRQQQMERKHVSYGIGGGNDGSECFLPKIRSILNSTHKKLYSLTEEYYRQKGSRNSTQPNDVAETFEQCMDGLIERCHGYRAQAEAYRNNCIDELHTQLILLMSTLEGLPRVIFGGVVIQSQERLKLTLLETLQPFTQEIDKLKTIKMSHESTLRPVLGHPERSNDLHKLCSEEDDRHLRIIETLRERSKRAKEIVQTESKKFLQSLLDNVPSLLALLDGAVSQEDIVPPSPTLPSQEELMRKYVKQEVIIEQSQSSTSTTYTNKCGSWCGVDDKTLTFGDKELTKKLASNVTSEKVTPAHKAVINARDCVLKEYQSWCHGQLIEITANETEEIRKEEKWHSTWQISVTTIKQLYQH